MELANREADGPYRLEEQPVSYECPICKKENEEDRTSLIDAISVLQRRWPLSNVAEHAVTLLKGFAQEIEDGLTRGTP